jgi:hypothetical protein
MNLIVVVVKVQPFFSLSPEGERMNRMYVGTKEKNEDCSLHRRRRRRLGGCTYVRNKRRRSYLTKEGHGVTIE